MQRVEVHLGECPFPVEHEGHDDSASQGFGLGDCLGVGYHLFGHLREFGLHLFHLPMQLRSGPLRPGV